MNILLQLGAFSFRGLEVPQRILLTTKQRLVVHHLGSGATAIDSLGKDTEVVSFRGIFSGEEARRRIHSIEYMRSQGVPVPLTWAAMTLSVVIRKFDLNYSTSQWVPYALSCYVVPAASYTDEDRSGGLLGSANTQINDIMELLQGTDFSPTITQSATLALLAARNFDTAPGDALQQIEPLVAAIENQMQAIEFEQVSSDDWGQSSRPCQARLLHEAVMSAKLQSSLALAHDRLGSIIVSATAGDL